MVVELGVILSVPIIVAILVEVVIRDAEREVKRLRAKPLASIDLAPVIVEQLAAGLVCQRKEERDVSGFYVDYSDAVGHKIDQDSIDPISGYR